MVHHFAGLALYRYALYPASVMDPVQDVLSRARRRWPTISASAAAIAQLRERWPGLREPITAGESERLEELFLACACSEGGGEALAVFEREYISKIPRFLAHMRAAPDFVDDVTQIVRERLFVGAEGRAPKIRDYAATGPLGAWVRVISVRVALDLRRRSSKPEMEGEPPVYTAAADGMYLRTRYRAILQDAINRAIAGLSAEQRELLRAHFVDGVGFDQLAIAHGIHKVTVWRRIAAARDSIVEATRAIAHEEAAISPADFDSILRSVHSQLDFSISHG